MQRALFADRDRTRIDSFARLERRALDGGAWVDYAPGWLLGHERLFERLEKMLPWRRSTQVLFDQEVETPRLIVGFPEDGPPPDPLLEVAERLSARYRVRFDRLSASLYRNGHDSVAWHRDREHRERNTSVVAIVSLGSPRRFLLRPREASGVRRSTAFSVGWGDLLVMGGTCQRTWEHAVPKVRHADPRIALMFRHEPLS